MHSTLTRSFLVLCLLCAPVLACYANPDEDIQKQKLQHEDSAVKWRLDIMQQAKNMYQGNLSDADHKKENENAAEWLAIALVSAIELREVPIFESDMRPDGGISPLVLHFSDIPQPGSTSMLSLFEEGSKDYTLAQEYALLRMLRRALQLTKRKPPLSKKQKLIAIEQTNELSEAYANEIENLLLARFTFNQNRQVVDSFSKTPTNSGVKDKLKIKNKAQDIAANKNRIRQGASSIPSRDKTVASGENFPQIQTNEGYSSWPSASQAAETFALSYKTSRLRRIEDAIRPFGPLGKDAMSLLKQSIELSVKQDFAKQLERYSLGGSEFPTFQQEHDIRFAMLETVNTLLSREMEIIANFDRAIPMDVQNAIAKEEAVHLMHPSIANMLEDEMLHKKITILREQVEQAGKLKMDAYLTEELKQKQAKFKKQKKYRSRINQQRIDNMNLDNDPNHKSVQAK